MPTYDVEATYAKIFSKAGLLSVNGRRNRKPFFFLNWGINVCINIMDKFAAGSLVIGVLYLVFIYILFTNSAKRFHDLNHPTWFACYNFIVFIPFVFPTNHFDNTVILLITVIIGLYTTFKKGTIGPNFYGPDPLEK